jgi:hypothetical protein
MEIIKRKILLEDSTDRDYNSTNWGKLKTSVKSFNMNILLTQSMDDMGIYLDMEYEPKNSSPLPSGFYSILTSNMTGTTQYTFMSGTQPLMNTYTAFDKSTLRNPLKVGSDYYSQIHLRITGMTDSKIEDVRTYAAGNPYRVNLPVEKGQYRNYTNTIYFGVSKIKSMGEPKVYVFDTIENSDLGTVNQIYGLRYLDYTGKTRTITYNNRQFIDNVTEFSYIGEGLNMTNMSLSALTKEEYLLGIIFPAEVKSDVFIDRGLNSVMDKHLKFSEISNLGRLANYGNGFYNLKKQ